MKRYQVATVEELQKKIKKRVVVNDIPILLVYADSVLYAVEDTCSHAGASLLHGEIEGTCVTCPHHGSQFDIRSGKALTLPAYIDLKTFRVITEGERVYVEI